MDFIWRAALVFLGGFALIRIVGRKSVAQTTLATTVAMIAIGAILVQPIVVDTLPRTLTVIAVFIAILIIMEYLQLKINWMEKILHGKAKIVIKDGEYNKRNLLKLRITVDKLEMYLRQNGISSVTDVKSGTIEPNGQFGYELTDDKKPLTIGEFKRLMASKLNQDVLNQPPQNSAKNIFDELTNSTIDNKDLK